MIRILIRWKVTNRANTNKAVWNPGW